MPVRCLTSTRFSMDAEILHWQGVSVGTSEDVSQGTWETFQDPITLEIRNTWVPANSAGPTTPGDPTVKTIRCLARGIVNGGTRLSGTTERFGDTYENVEYLKMWVPASVKITKRDRITNIRVRKGGEVLWKDEEFEGGTRPTVFNVNGVTPLFDPFNRLTEWYVELEKADA